MNFMTETELRELDYELETLLSGRRVEREQNWSVGDNVITYFNVPKYTTSYAALEVLQKCAEKLDLKGDGVQINYKHSMWSVCISECPDVHSKYVEAETIELAICLFAKQLFKCKN